jgi:hypothetical protein
VKIDSALHGERAQRGGGKLVFEEVLSEQPAGAVFDWNGTAYLVTGHGHGKCCSCA